MKRPGRTSGEGHARGRATAAWLFAISLVTVFGLALRWIGIDHGLPHNNEPDDVIVLEAHRLRHPKL